MNLKFDWFLPGMLVAVILAWIFPEPGARGGSLEPELTTKIGVALIFFLHGVAISFAVLKAGVLQWKLHLTVQSCVFGLFPLFGLVIYFGLAPWMASDLRLGFFFLCALPSTVSSSVAMTAAARGNVAAAVFNASLSSLLGVLFTPAWMALVAENSDAMGSFGEVVLDLVLWLVMPLVVGQLCRGLLGAWAERNMSRINALDKLIILFLAYTSFCDSVVAGVWTDNGWNALLSTVALSLILFWSALGIVGFVSDALGFPWKDRVATVFCGSKKSLATGVPMARLMFGSYSGLGLVLLPLMIYHSLQLVICGVLANRWGKLASTEVQ